MTNENCLSYWFPILQAAEIPVPHTKIIRTDCELIHLLDGVKPDGYDNFIDELYNLAISMDSLPLFLKTGVFSGKHNWENTCFVNPESPETLKAALESHVTFLVNDSIMVDFMGLPTDVWVVREFLQLEIATVLEDYGNMPLAREFRAFIDKGEVTCIHPYWPAKAVEQGSPKDEQWHDHWIHMCMIGPDGEEIDELLTKVAKAFADKGGWSVDICQTAEIGEWYVTDMAKAQASFHWDGCVFGKSKSVSL